MRHGIVKEEIILASKIPFALNVIKIPLFTQRNKILKFKVEEFDRPI